MTCLRFSAHTRIPIGEQELTLGQPCATIENFTPKSTYRYHQLLAYVSTIHVPLPSMRTDLWRAPRHIPVCSQKTIIEILQNHQWRKYSIHLLNASKGNANEYTQRAKHPRFSLEPSKRATIPFSRVLQRLLYQEISLQNQNFPSSTSYMRQNDDQKCPFCLSLVDSQSFSTHTS